MSYHFGSPSALNWYEGTSLHIYKCYCCHQAERQGPCFVKSWYPCGPVSLACTWQARADATSGLASYQYGWFGEVTVRNGNLFQWKCFYGISSKQFTQNNFYKSNMTKIKVDYFIQGVYFIQWNVFSIKLKWKLLFAHSATPKIQITCHGVSLLEKVWQLG